jgi:chromosome segregation ATPase
MHAAQEHQSKRAVDQLLGEVLDDQTSLADYEQKVDDATREYESLKKLILDVQRERQAGELALQRVSNDRDRALEEVLKHHPSVIELYAHFNQLRAEVASVTEALRVIGKTIHHHDYQSAYSGPVDFTLAKQWGSALKDFATNPETALPEVNE